MSLSKQLLLLISLIFLIMFSGNFILSVKSICSYLEVESEIHMQDTATSLGLSLSPHMDANNDPILQTMMNAIFDTGYYKEMTLINVNGDEVIQLTSPVQMEGVPNWFISLLPMKTATAVSEISSGWNISGTLYVTGNPAYAYMKLYQLVKETFLYSLLFFFAAFSLLILVLQLTLKPLKEIQKQANKIAAGDFVISEQLPWTTEVRNVTTSMNSMSQKISDVIDRLNQRLDIFGDTLKRDPLTHLFNRTSFYQDLKQALTSGQSGYGVYIKIDRLADITNSIGNQTADKLLKEFATLLLNDSAQDITAYRLYGSEFTLLTQQQDVNDVTEYTEQLTKRIKQLGQRYEIEDMVHIGIVGLERGSSPAQLMSALIEAYKQARLIGQNAFFVQLDPICSMSEQEWEKLIQQTIDHNTPIITYTSRAYNYHTEPPQQVMVEAVTQVSDNSGNPVSIDTLFSMAQKFNLAESLDRCIINKIIQSMEAEHSTSPTTINLSMVSVSSTTFHAWLKARLEKTHIKTSLITFSVSAYTATKNLPAFSSFSHFVQQLGARVLLKRYSSALIDIDTLKYLHINYIRLERELTEDIQQNVSKSDFLQIIQEVASLLDIKLLADSVRADHDFEFVKKLGLYGISR